jgi:hypothetical protein
VDLPLAARRGILVNFVNAAPFTHSRSIAYLHDAQAFQFPDSYPLKKRLLHQQLTRMAGRTARRVITISQFSADALVHFGLARRENIAVIHNGADHILRPLADESVLARFHLEPFSYVLMLGSGLPYKNNRIVYQAWKASVSRSPWRSWRVRSALPDGSSDFGPPGTRCSASCAMWAI